MYFSASVNYLTKERAEEYKRKAVPGTKVLTKEMPDGSYSIVTLVDVPLYDDQVEWKGEGWD